MGIQEKQVDILFVIPPYHHRNGSGQFFPLGISSIIAYIEAHGFTWDCIDCTRIIDTLTDDDLEILKNELKSRLPEYAPAITGIGPCVTPGAKGLKVVSDCCVHAYGAEKVFAGGPFTGLPSQEWFFYEYLNLRYLIKGEGEIAVCMTIEAVKSGRSMAECEWVSVVGHSHINFINNLNELPFPRRIQLEKNTLSDRRKGTGKEKSVAHIVASRGCPYRCSYCVSGNLKSVRFRKRSADSVVSEMKMLVDEYHVDDIVFYDDCFFTSKNTIHREIESFCSSLLASNINVTWQIEIRPDIITEITDGELNLLEKCGCRQMNVGIERTDRDGAALFGKAYDIGKLKTYISHLHSICNIRVTGTFILGGRGETEQTVKKLIRNSLELGLDGAEYSPLFVYPDTPIYTEMFDNPREWLSVVLAEKEPWGEVVYETKALSKEKLMELTEEAYATFYRGTKLEETDHVNDRYKLKG